MSRYVLPDSICLSPGESEQWRADYPNRLEIWKGKRYRARSLRTQMRRTGPFVLRLPECHRQSKQQHAYDKCAEFLPATLRMRNSCLLPPGSSPELLRPASLCHFLGRPARGRCSSQNQKRRSDSRHMGCGSHHGEERRPGPWSMQNLIPPGNRGTFRGMHLRRP